MNARRMLLPWAAVALSLAASPVAAQVPADAGIFRLYQGTAEIGRETFLDTGSTLTSTVTIPLLGIRLASEVVRDATGRGLRLTTRVFRLPADTLVRTYTAVADGDSLRMSQQDQGHPARQWVKAARPDDFLPDQSTAAIASLVSRSRRQDRTWHVWLPSADSLFDLGVAFHGDSAQVTVGPQRMALVIGGDLRVQSVTSAVGGVQVVRQAGDSLPPLAGLRRPAPDYSAPAGAAYSAEEVRVPAHDRHGDTLSFGCTLTTPHTGGPRFPAAVTITGSGLEDRDENLWPLVPAYRVFRQVAERLATEGIAVLRCDDRAFGASTGHAEHATSEDFARDFEAQLAWLRARSDVDPARTAVIGHSEGGMIGPLIASRDPRLAAVVVMAGPGKSGLEILRDQVAWPYLSAPALDSAVRGRLIANAQRQLLADTTLGLWMRFFRTYDPLPTARRVRQPVLILQGALDRQVSAGQADTLGAAIRAGGNRDVTVRVFPGLNHLFLVSPTDGSPSEYASLTNTSVGADVLDTLATWLKARLTAPARAGRGR
jgi:hypothetical protein